MMHNDAKPHSARVPRLSDLSPNDNVCCIMKWTVEQLKLPNNLLTNGCYSCMFNFKLLADVSDMSDPLIKETFWSCVMKTLVAGGWLRG